MNWALREYKERTFDRAPSFTKGYQPELNQGTEKEKVSTAGWFLTLSRQKGGVSLYNGLEVFRAVELSVIRGWSVFRGSRGVGERRRK